MIFFEILCWDVYESYFSFIFGHCLLVRPPVTMVPRKMEVCRRTCHRMTCGWLLYQPGRLLAPLAHLRPCERINFKEFSIAFKENSMRFDEFSFTPSNSRKWKCVAGRVTGWPVDEINSKTQTMQKSILNRNNAEINTKPKQCRNQY